MFFADVISDESFHAKRQWHGGKGQFPKTKNVSSSIYLALCVAERVPWSISPVVRVMPTISDEKPIG